MTIEYLKAVTPPPRRDAANVSDIVKRILEDIEQGGEAKALEYAKTFDKYEGNIILTAEEITAASALVPDRIKQVVLAQLHCEPTFTSSITYYGADFGLRYFVAGYSVCSQQYQKVCRTTKGMHSGYGMRNVTGFLCWSEMHPIRFMWMLCSRR